MAEDLKLQVATPERLLVDEQVATAELPGQNGYFAVLSGHAPLLSVLAPGFVAYEGGGGKRVLMIDGGFAEVFENQIRVLADYAEFAAKVDSTNANQQLTEAEQALRKAQNGDEAEAAVLAIKRAQARLDAKTKSSGTPA